MSELADLIYESISDAEQRKAAVEAEIAALTEMHEIARTRLNGSSPAEASRPAAARPTQPDERNAADPPSRKPASRPPRQTSARRAPSVPSSGASQGPAPAGGEVRAGSRAAAAERRDQVLELVAKANGQGVTQADLANDLGFNPVAYLQALEKERKVRRTPDQRKGANGGRPSPVWAKATTPEQNRAAGAKPVEQAALEAAGVAEPDGELTALDNQVLHTLTELGPRTQFELAEDLDESAADVGRSVGRLIRAERVKAARYAGRHQTTYELEPVE